ncbi:glycerate kinase family protein [Gudongella sp. SC589]|jgi:glycerate kinase|uniref:glycerate kinase family protein n=1 Tax=Gudongella sp. SC589 TaxID=3385990 RepID=UPI0039049CF3
MKILIASDSFKGSATTMEVADSIEKGFAGIYQGVEIVKVPMADGGEGTVETLVAGMDSEFAHEEVTGPLGEGVQAKYGIIKDEIAIIEMAEASGLVLVKEEMRNPLLTTTYGTGELILSALKRGYRKIYVGIGGSATNDGGMGMAKALGYRFLDRDGNEIPDGGGALGQLQRIDRSKVTPLIEDAKITVMCDVENPLYGTDGAAYVYGPQKGANPEMVKLLDENLKHFADILKRDMDVDIGDIPGSGAAGGLGGGLMAFCRAELKPGIEMVLDIQQFEGQLQGVDLVITGEGRIDGQSAKGKVPAGVAKLARKLNKPVVAIAGGIGEGTEGLYSMGIDLILPIVDRPMGLGEAMGEAKTLLEKTGERLARILMLSEKLK